MIRYELFSQGSDGPVVYLAAGDLTEAEQVFHLLQEQIARPFRLAAFAVDHWNDALSPWPAPPVFGKQGFGGRAAVTLRWLEDTLTPLAEPTAPTARLIGGYSLGGLFSLWAFYESKRFAGAASCSGSLWYPGWPDWAQQQAAPAGSRLYLSLGEREPLARDPVLARVGEATRRQAALAQSQGLETTLTWHPGGHFDHPERRTAQGLAWLIEKTR